MSPAASLILKSRVLPLHFCDEINTILRDKAGMMWMVYGGVYGADTINDVCFI
jgi:hypothetical protein